jgi:hypothetical protein
MTRGTGSYLSMPEAARESMYSAIAARLPVGRVGTAEDIAAATLMLMTNTFITGVTLDVDGAGSPFWTAVRKLGLEGVVGKRSGSRYEIGERSGAWIKSNTLANTLVSN